MRAATRLLQLHANRIPIEPDSSSLEYPRLRAMIAVCVRLAEIKVRAEFVGTFMRLPPLVLMLRERRELLSAVVMWMPLCPDTRLSSHDERMGRLVHNIDSPMVILWCCQWSVSQAEIARGLTVCNE
jgi:hypothetical protein